MHKILPAEYLTLARILATPVVPSSSPKPVNQNLSDFLASQRSQIMDLRAIHSDDADINQVASLAADAMSDLVLQVEGLNVSVRSKPGNGPASLIPLLEVVAGIHTGHWMMALGAVDQLYQKAHAQSASFEAWDQANRSQIARFWVDEQRLRAAAILLSKISARYCPTECAANARIEAAIVHSWGPLSCDILKMENGGADLEDCTITVILTGANGETCTNTHFIPRWPVHTFIYCAYSQGTVIQGQALGRNTVAAWSSAAITIISQNLRAQTRTDFNQTFQDQAIATLCKQLKFSVSYGRHMPFFGSAYYIPAIGMQGLDFIPDGGATLILRNQSETKTVQLSFKSWKSGEHKAFPNIHFSPDSATLAITFPETSYRYETAFKN